MNEQLISLETAKLAKEKGFKEYVDRKWVIYLADEVLFDFRKGEDFVSVDKGTTRIESATNQRCAKIETYAAPSQALLAKWLRDVHGVHISIRRAYWGENEEYNNFIYLKGKDKHEDCTLGNEFETYEDALENALLQALTLL